MNDTTAIQAKDKEGWPILIGSYVRVERLGLKSWRAWVTEIEAEGVLKLRDNDGRMRHAKATEAVVIRPSKVAKRKKKLVAAADEIGAALGRKRRSRF